MALSADNLALVDDYLDPKGGGEGFAVTALIKPYNRIDGATQSVRVSQVFSRDDHVSEHRDPDFDVRYPARLLQAYRLEASVMDGQVVGGRSGLAAMTIKIDVSGDPDDWTAADAWISLALRSDQPLVWEGAPVTLELGQVGAGSGFSELRRGVVDSIEWDREVITLQVRDEFETLREPIKGKPYQGSSIGGDDLRGKSKPWGMGPGTDSQQGATNVPGVRLGIDAQGREQFQFHVTPGWAALTPPGGGVIEVRAGGIVQTEGEAASYVIVDDLTGLPKYPAEIIAFNADPNFGVTAAVRGFDGGESVFNRKDAVTDLMTKVLGFLLNEIDGPGLGILSTDAPAPVVAWFDVGEEVSGEEILDLVLRPLGYWWTNRVGQLAAAWLTEPAEQSADQTLKIDDFRDPFSRKIHPPRRLRSWPPIWRQTHRYRRVYETQGEGDLADLVDSSWARLVSQEWRERIVADSRIQDAYPLAGELEWNSPVGDNLGASDGVGSGEWARQEAVEAFLLYARPRSLWELRLGRKWFRCDIGDVVAVSYLEQRPDGTTRDIFGFDRSGSIELEGGGTLEMEDGSGDVLLEAGTEKHFLVVGMEEDLARHDFRLVVWG